MQPALLFSETLQLEYFEKIAADLATHGFSISSNLLPQNWVINLRNFVKKEREEGSFQVAGIGKMQPVRLPVLAGTTKLSHK